MHAAHATLHPIADAGRVLSGLPEEMRSRVGRAREIDVRRRETAHGDPLPTALAPFDLLLEGGLPRGQLVELVGSRSSGRFSAVLALLAAATDVGEAAALIDLGDGFSPAEGEESGIELERLLWLRPRDLKGALTATEVAIEAGFQLVVLDLGPPPVRGRTYGEGVWLRLARAAQAQGSALLVASPYRVSGPAAGAVLRVQRERVVWQGEAGEARLLTGLGTQLVLEKQRSISPQRVSEGRMERLQWAVAGLPEPETQRPPRSAIRHLRALPPLTAQSAAQPETEESSTPRPLFRAASA